MGLLRTTSMALFMLCMFSACQTRFASNIGQMTGLTLSDEEKITQVLEDVQRGMENRRVYQVLAHVSRAYRDRSNRDYNELSKDLNFLMRNYRNIRVTRATPRIQVQGNRATVIDTFGTNADAVDAHTNPPVSLQGQVVILMERYKDTWQILEWGPIS